MTERELYRMLARQDRLLADVVSRCRCCGVQILTGTKDRLCGACREMKEMEEILWHRD